MCMMCKSPVKARITELDKLLFANVLDVLLEVSGHP